MSIKNGYGSISEFLIATRVSAAPDIYDTNLNSIIQLPASADKRIFTINCGYTLPEASYLSRAIYNGRLLVVGTKFVGISEFIDPLSTNLPDSLSSSQIYFDTPIFGASYFSGEIRTNIHHFDFSSGILIPKSVDASIILTFCVDSTVAYPDSGGCNAFLNVHGFMGGGDKIFKDV